MIMKVTKEKCLGILIHAKEVLARKKLFQQLTSLCHQGLEKNELFHFTFQFHQGHMHTPQAFSNRGIGLDN